ncbi:MULTISPECIES: DoxX family protein [unclassified Arcicella]|uniref:DoxX family protein n=1 Tax=unclassified Arcicella TaxID=2644986 RepID=UPI0028606440|nr:MULTISPECIES: DoxX family protein [unclassified Arcicella]MDR6563535.1 putative membrane protein YphA (DoxX/SURF4 family) [Arcicella sp. BE51]MDR6813353.1 putative membrane protein YphA (DoxX/SURF4 family) [Arcicella sp. BE140]MDR6824666.1 putative membrane protein YphA (DoxX/SURF4 family) [Arcicella sp. BE139]
MVCGELYANWGNWQNFVDYSNSVNSLVATPLGNIFAVIATVLEIIIPIFLLIGYTTKLASLAAVTLLVSFGLMMWISFGIKPSLDYFVWTSAGAILLLSQCDIYSFSVDNVMESRG